MELIGYEMVNGGEYYWPIPLISSEEIFESEEFIYQMDRIFDRKSRILNLAIPL
jgi:hypothetical protein